MSVLSSVQKCAVGKRRRDTVEVDIPEPPAKRHHQRHPTPPPERKGRFQQGQELLLRSVTLSEKLQIAYEGKSRHILQSPPGIITATATSPVPVTVFASATFNTSTSVLVKCKCDNEENETPNETQSKRQSHQHRLTSPPLNRKSRPWQRLVLDTQIRYTLRRTADRIRRGITASPPAFFTPPNSTLASPNRSPAPAMAPATTSLPNPTSFPVLASIEIAASVHPSTPALAEPTSTTASVPVSTHSIPIQVVNAGHVSTPVPAPIVAHPLTSTTILTPSRPSVDIWPDSMRFKSMHVSWDELSARERARLYALYDDLIIRLWKHRELFNWSPLTSYCLPMGLSSCDGPDDIETLAVVKKHPDIVKVVQDFREDFTKLYELCNHRKCRQLFVNAHSGTHGETSAAFHDGLDAPINAAHQYFRKWLTGLRALTEPGKDASRFIQNLHLDFVLTLGESLLLRICLPAVIRKWRHTSGHLLMNQDLMLSKSVYYSREYKDMTAS